MVLSPLKSVAVFVAVTVTAIEPTVAQTNSEDSESFAEGLAIYNENCAICHGPNGDGGGSLAPQFTPRPRDFTQGSFKFRSTGFGEPPAAVDLLTTITRGVEGSYGRSMPSFEHLSFDQQVKLLKVIQEFAGIANYGVSRGIQPRPDSANAEKGRQLYVEQGCIECHGANGDGLGVLAQDLRDADGLPIRPTDFRTGLFKGGNNPEQIWMRIQTGLDGTPMPSFSRNLTLDESWSLVEYVLEFSDEE